MTSAKRVKNLTEGPILPLILKFSIPLMITGILQLLFNTADTIIVGRWGGDTPEACENALAAVGSCGSLITLLTVLLGNLSLGAGVSVAQDIGARKLEDVSKTVHTAISLCLVSGVFALLVGIFAARPLLILMGTDPAVLDQAVLYTRAYFIGIPASMLYNYCAAILRSAGETVRPVRYLLIAGVVNVGLNLLMVLVFRLGALGVGIATAASFLVECALILCHMYRTDAVYRFEPRKLRFHGDKLKIILRIGIPAGVQGLIFSFSHVLIQGSVNSFGKAAVAGNAAAANLEGYAYQPMIAFYHATVTLVGQHKGAGKYARMKRCIMTCALCTTVLGLVLGWLMILLGPVLLSLYAPGNIGAIDMGMSRMWAMLSAYFLCGLMEMGSGIMRGLGRSTTSMITSLVGSVGFRVIWIFAVFPSHHTPIGLYLCFPIAWLLTALAHYTLSAIAIRREERTAQQAPPTEAAPAT